MTIIGAVVALATVVAVVLTFVLGDDDPEGSTVASATTLLRPARRPRRRHRDSSQPLKRPQIWGANCEYTPTPEPASKKVDPPHGGKVPTDPATVSVSMATNEGNIGLQLDNAKSPCTVNNFASLAQKGFFNDTPCHRLTTSQGLGVLQCGDPSGSGRRPGDTSSPTSTPPTSTQGRPGTAGSGELSARDAGHGERRPGHQRSQFFLVYKDSQLPPGYTVFGTIDQTGLATLDKIAAAGVAGGGQDGKPQTPVQIKSVLLD